MEDHDGEFEDEALEDDEDCEEEELEHIPLQIDSDSADEDNEADESDNVLSAITQLCNSN